MKDPTPTQQKLLDEIIRYIEQTGSSPTVRYLLTRKGHLLETTPDNRRISLSNRYRTVVVRPEGDDEGV